MNTTTIYQIRELRNNNLVYTTTNIKRARNKKDKLDLKYGAIGYTIVRL